MILSMNVNKDRIEEINTIVTKNSEEGNLLVSKVNSTHKNLNRALSIVAEVSFILSLLVTSLTLKLTLLGLLILLTTDHVVLLPMLIEQAVKLIRRKDVKRIGELAEENRTLIDEQHALMENNTEQSEVAKS